MPKTTRRHSAIFSLILLFFCTSAVSQSAQKKEDQSANRDWVVACQDAGKGDGSETGCVMTQVQKQKGGDKLLYAMMLRPSERGSVEGTILLPLGVALDHGVVMQVKGREPSKPFKYKTCLAKGCIVPIRMDSSQVAIMSSSETMKLSITGLDERRFALVVSLKGFKQSYEQMLNRQN